MLQAVALTDIGKRRKLNQDFIYATRESIGNLPNVFIVADGMGGHNGGELAAKWSVEAILREINASSANNPVKILDDALAAANREIRRKSYEEPTLRGMGTTIVAASIDGNVLRIANVGDSRLYIIDPDSQQIRQITKDHSLVEEMVRMGGMTKEVARNHPDKHIITRAIGAKDELIVDFFYEELRPGEIVLMCSDGLSNMLYDEEIVNITQKERSIEDMASQLVFAANEKGGRDNIAIILILFGDR